MAGDITNMRPDCPLCGNPAAFHAAATDVEYFTTSDQFGFFHCNACDVLFIHPMLADRLNLIYPSNYYAFQAGGEKDFAVRIKEMLDARMLRRVLRSIEGDTIRVLDIGGGTGWLSDIVRRIDPRVTTTQIVDIDAKAQAWAQARGHRYFCGRIEDFADDEKFDLILALNLIEHVPQPDQLLGRMQGLLSPRGRLVIKTPNFRSLDAILFRHRCWGGYHCPRHFVLFSRRSLERTLQRAGLLSEQFAYTQGAPFWSVSIMELLRHAGWVTVSAERPPGRHPLMPYLHAVTAAFDFIRRPFSPLSQMIVVARRADSSAAPGG